LRNRRLSSLPSEIRALSAGDIITIQEFQEIFDKVKFQEIFDKVIVAIANNAEKRSLFRVEERLEMVKTIFKDTPNVIVDCFKGLLVDYVAKTNAR
jgi:hypothetical protein